MGSKKWALEALTKNFQSLVSALFYEAPTGTHEALTMTKTPKKREIGSPF